MASSSSGAACCTSGSWRLAERGPARCAPALNSPGQTACGRCAADTASPAGCPRSSSRGAQSTGLPSCLTTRRSQPCSDLRGTWRARTGSASPSTPPTLSSWLPPRRTSSSAASASWRSTARWLPAPGLACPCLRRALPAACCDQLPCASPCTAQLPAGIRVGSQQAEGPAQCHAAQMLSCPAASGVLGSATGRVPVLHNLAEQTAGQGGRQAAVYSA